MRLTITAVCDRGPTRDGNEDAVLVGERVCRDEQLHGVKELDSDCPPFVVAVADGLGGANAGERASQLVLEMLRDAIRALPPGMNEAEYQTAIKAMCAEVHQAVLQEGLQDPDKAGMGSTAVALVHYSGRLDYLSAGDSRLYRYRDATLMQVTRDHSVVPDARPMHGVGRILTNSFGGGPEFFADTGPVAGRTSNDDVFLLCTDGLTDMLADDEIEALLGGGDPASTLLESAIRKGGDDNISFVIVTLSDLPES